MKQAVDRQEVRLAGVALGRARHICALFHGRDEWYDVLLPFIREGMPLGDKAFHIIDGGRRAEHLERLTRGGIDIEAAERRGQLEVKGWLEIKGWDEAYLRGGRFDQDAMLAFLEAALKRGNADGFRLTRLIAEMEWALLDLPGVVSDLLEYEARLNYILPRYDDAVT
jgi:MEDS: MEthanogen/methylotroph, DcmR Sensory domain